MKKLFILLSCISFMLVSCYDDSMLQEQITDLEQRVDSLEILCDRLNTNYMSLQTIVEALDSCDVVTAVAPIMEGTEVIGYTITFKKSGSITLYLDSPDMLKVSDGNWMCSEDEGATWQKVGKAAASANESYISKVRVDGQYIYIILSDGKTEIKVPISNIPPVLTVNPGYNKVLFTGKANPVSVDYQVGVVVGDSENAVREIIASNDVFDHAASTFAEDGSFEIVADCYGDAVNYYAVFIYSNGVFAWSDFMSFETNGSEMTAGVKSVSGAVAVIEGKISLKFNKTVTAEIQYFGASDESSHMDVSSAPVALNSDGSFSVSLDDLQYNMPYGAYLVVDYGTEEYEDKEWGERFEFRTEANDAQITCAIWDITETTALVTGKVIMKHASKSPSVFVEYRTYEEQNDYDWYNYTSVPVTLSATGDYSVTIPDLRSAVEYELRLRVYYNDVYKWDDSAYKISETLRFLTKNKYDVVSDFDISAAIDLSSSESANSYVVSEGGMYKFQAVKGNDKSLTLSSARTAHLVWESFGTSEQIQMLDLITEVCYKDGYVAFKTAEPFREGNAVVCVKDADGNILWSWHIWMTDQPAEQVYYEYDFENSTWDNPIFTSNVAGVMMDRNLGATTAYPEESGIYGLLYQWGRKDPFPSGVLDDYYNSQKAPGSIDWKSVWLSSETGTVDYSIAHPATYIKSNQSDWLYDSGDEEYDTRWMSDKTIYDPCPAGWRVPDGGEYFNDFGCIWEKAGFSELEDDAHYDEITNCVIVPGNEDSYVYPAAGYIEPEFNLGNVGYRGEYWVLSTSHVSYMYFYINYDNTGCIDPIYYDSYSAQLARSVRCMKE